MNRQKACSETIYALDKDITPLHCIYRGRINPQSFIRMEIPFLCGNKNKEQVEEAIRIVAWQHEIKWQFSIYTNCC